MARFSCMCLGQFTPPRAPCRGVGEGARARPAAVVASLALAPFPRRLSLTPLSGLPEPALRRRPLVGRACLLCLRPHCTVVTSQADNSRAAKTNLSVHAKQWLEWNRQHTSSGSKDKPSSAADDLQPSDSTALPPGTLRSNKQPHKHWPCPFCDFVARGKLVYQLKAKRLQAWHPDQRLTCERRPCRCKTLPTFSLKRSTGSARLPLAIWASQRSRLRKTRTLFLPAPASCTGSRPTLRVTLSVSFRANLSRQKAFAQVDHLSVAQVVPERASASAKPGALRVCTPCPANLLSSTDACVA